MDGIDILPSAATATAPALTTPRVPVVAIGTEIVPELLVMFEPVLTLPRTLPDAVEAFNLPPSNSSPSSPPARSTSSLVTGPDVVAARPLPACTSVSVPPPPPPSTSISSKRYCSCSKLPFRSCALMAEPG